MRFFTCLIDPDGRGIAGETCKAYEGVPRRRGLTFQWQLAGPAAVLTAWDDPYGPPLVVKHRDWIAAGTARLDNRADVKRWGNVEGEGHTDLELVLGTIAQDGPKHIPHVLGDFGFIAWRRNAPIAVAACDAFGVGRLFYAQRPGLIAFASRAEALTIDERYDVEYLTALLAMHKAPTHRTAFAGVRPVQPAEFATVDHSVIKLHEYWRATDFEIEHAWTKSEPDAIEACRNLLAESVRLRMGGPGETWAQLSGGLDSSSVVSVAQWLVERGAIDHGLAGTVTFVDRQNTNSDERAFSNTVVERWGIHNEAIIDPPTWHDPEHDLPLNDQPTFGPQTFPRDLRLCSTVRAAGGRILLTGWGGDELFLGSMLFFADWMVTGRVWAAIREMVRRAAIGRVSFWELAYRNAFVPLLPQWVQRRVASDDLWSPRVHPWLDQAKLRQYGLTARSPLAPEYAGPLGGKYRHAVATKIGTLPAVTGNRLLSDSLDVRHPMLYRPLVEFALKLPPDLRARPHAHRWVLRQAMCGILPEKVRTRVGKPDTGEVLASSLAAARERLASLVRDPILAQLGVLDPVALRAAFEAAQQLVGRGTYVHAQLQATLAVEVWLQQRSGRWPSSSRIDKPESFGQVNQFA